MCWIEDRSDLDVEIANCYSQIEELKEKIRILEVKKKEEERIDKLIQQLSANLKG